MSDESAIVKMFRYLWYGVDGIRKLLHLALLLVVFGVVLAAIPTDVPVVPRAAALVIQPDGVLVDELSGDAFDRAFAELEGSPIRETLVRDVTSALERAAKDPNVPGVVLDLNRLAGGGLTKLQTVASAVRDFRASGKPVYAYGSYYSQGAYLIAAEATEVWMDPAGGIFLQGFGRFGNYFREALDKLSIDWNVFRVGSYKSFGEPYMRNDMSPEARKESDVLLGGLWASYASDVAAARDVDVDSLTTLANDLAGLLDANGGDWAAVAIDNGLVDKLMDRPAKTKALIERFGAADDDGYNGISVAAYLAQTTSPALNMASEPTVAVIVASGPVVDGEAPPGQIGGDSIAALIRSARTDDDVRALVMRVDSGGGSVFASDVIQAELTAFRETGRPYVASMGSVAASAGYWISASADRIFASPTTITGSIGVIGMFPTFQRSLERLGVYTDGVGTSQLAGQFRADTTLSADAKQVIQRLVDADYRRFITGVAEFRGMTAEAVDAVAQGRVWSGEDALKFGLVDEFGGIDAAIQAAANLAKLDEGGYRVDYVSRSLSPLEELLVSFAQTGARFGVRSAPSRQGLLRQVERWLGDRVSQLASFNDPKGLYSICFCVIN
ncbi:MAG: signal peptide peptidase SppA [Pseudomonadota bacterium]